MKRARLRVYLPCSPFSPLLTHLLQALLQRKALRLDFAHLHLLGADLPLQVFDLLLHDGDLLDHLHVLVMLVVPVLAVVEPGEVVELLLEHRTPVGLGLQPRLHVLCERKAAAAAERSQ